MQNDEDNTLNGGYHNDSNVNSLFAGGQQSSLFDIPPYGPTDGSIGSATEQATEEFSSSLVGGHHASDQSERKRQLPPSPDFDSDRDGDGATTTVSSTTLHEASSSNRFPTASLNDGLTGQRVYELQQQLSILNQQYHPPHVQNWLTNSGPIGPPSQTPAGAIPSVQALLSRIPQQPQAQMLQPNAQPVGPMGPQQQKQQQQTTNNALVSNAMLPLIHPVAQLAGSAPFPYGFAGLNSSNGSTKMPMGNPLFIPWITANANSCSTRSMLPHVTPQGFTASSATQSNLQPILPPARQSKRPLTAKGTIVGGGSIEPFPVRFHASFSFASHLFTNFRRNFIGFFAKSKGKAGVM